MFSRMSVLFLLVVCLTGCAVVTDKGRLDTISEYNKDICGKKVNVLVFVEKDVRRTWKGVSDAHSYEHEKFKDKIIEKLQTSECVSNIEATPIAVSNLPKDTMYIQIRKEVTYGGFPLADIFSLVVPIYLTNEYKVDAIVEYNDKKQTYNIEDHFKFTMWSAGIILAPFVEQADSYNYKKTEDLIEALVLSMKKDGFFTANETIKTSMLNKN